MALVVGEGSISMDGKGCIEDFRGVGFISPTAFVTVFIRFLFLGPEL